MNAVVQDLSAWGITQESLSNKLHAQRLAFLEKQGWSPDILARFDLSFHPNTPANGAAPFWHPKCSGQLQSLNYIGIPYFNVNGAEIFSYVFAAGTEIPFRRARLLDFTKKSGKYQSYAKGGTAIYIPHDKTNPNYWDKVAIDPKTPLMLTEGEFDAISGYLLGVPTLGLGGLDCFLKKDSREPTHGGKEFAWQGRKVFICPDQDEESTHDAPFKGQSSEGVYASVAIAAERLANNLSLLGAVPFYVYVVRTKVGKEHVGEKVGLSEYLKLGGTKEDLLSTAAEAKTEDAKVVDLLNKYAVLGPDVIELETSKIITSKHFDRVHANKRIWNGKHYEQATERWLTHSKRYTVKELVFRPNCPPGMQPDSTFNLWRGFAIQPGTLGPEEDAKIIAALETLSIRMWGAKHWPWVRGCIAHLILHPEVLRQHMLILQSKVTGIGKSQFFKLLLRLIGPKHGVYTDLERFFGKFNLAYAGTLLPFIDEIAATPKQSVKLRRQVTSDVFEVEGKGKDSYAVPWCGLLCGATNSAVAVYTTPEDRRVFQVTPDVHPDFKGEWQPQVHEILKLLNKPESLPVIMAYFANPDWISIEVEGKTVVFYDPLADAPRTDSLEQSLEASRGKVEQAGEVFFEFLPEVFAFTTETSEGIDSITGPTKEVIDYVKAKAGHRGLIQVRMEGRQAWVTVFKKHGELEVVKNTQGKALLAGEHKLTLTREAYEATNAAIVKFNSRNLAESVSGTKGLWQVVD